MPLRNTSPTISIRKHGQEDLWLDKHGKWTHVYANRKRCKSDDVAEAFASRHDIDNGQYGLFPNSVATVMYEDDPE